MNKIWLNLKFDMGSYRSPPSIEARGNVLRSLCFSLAILYAVISFDDLRSLIAWRPLKMQAAKQGSKATIND